jgi:glutathione-independent formaldehyde dehydrogenase
MPGNRAVVYMGPGRVEIQTTDYPTYEMKDGPGVNKANVGRKVPHGAILKTVATNICGSDQHMVRGRTTAPEGLVLGHEITGEVVDVGRDVEYIKVGDVASVPFNISCGRCRNCKERKTGVCLNVNPDRPGSAYGYVDMGGWIGGQAEYVLVPYADWNLLPFPDRDQAMEKILDLAMLTDIFPTGYHGCVSAGVTTGSTVYIAGAGPVGLAAATSAWLLGASVVIVGDLNEERLAQARSFGCETVNISQGDPAEQVQQILGHDAPAIGQPLVDSAVDAVGFEARPRRRRTDRDAGHGAQLAHGDHSRRWRDRSSRPVRDGGPGRRRRGGQGRLVVPAPRTGLGEVGLVRDRPVPGDEVQPGADDGDPARPGADREERQRHADLAGPGARGIHGVRQGRGP